METCKQNVLNVAKSDIKWRFSRKHVTITLCRQTSTKITLLTLLCSKLCRHKGRTNWKVMWGVGKIQKKLIQRKVAGKKSSKEEVKNKNYCKVNCTVGLTNCTCLKGTSAGTLYADLLLAVSPGRILISLQLGKRTAYSPFNSILIHFVRSNFIMGSGCQKPLQKNPYG